MQGGIHALSEKPAGVHTKQVKEMNEAAAASGKVFAIMFNQRTSPTYRKVKELVESTTQELVDEIEKTGGECSFTIIDGKS